jgi:hypothetical protein
MKQLALPFMLRFEGSLYPCPKCKGLAECICTHPKVTRSMSGQRVSADEQWDLTMLSNISYGMRLARGFAIMSGNKHDL